MKSKLIKFKKYLHKHEIISTILSFFVFLLLNKKRIKKDNYINIKKSFFYKSKFIIYGKNNKIEFDDLCFFKNSTIIIKGNNNFIRFGKEINGNNVNITIENNNNSLLVGDKTYFAGEIHIGITEGTNVVIGNDCLFSNGISIRTGDSHSVLDKKTRKRINFAKNVTINNHVWITERVLLLKGALINNDSIVASNSVVTKQFNDSNIIIGGSPAKVIKDNITWDIDR